MAAKFTPEDVAIALAVWVVAIWLVVRAYLVWKTL